MFVRDNIFDGTLMFFEQLELFSNFLNFRFFLQYFNGLGSPIRILGYLGLLSTKVLLSASFSPFPGYRNALVPRNTIKPFIVNSNGVTLCK